MRQPIPLNFGRKKSHDRLYYFGHAADAPSFYEDRLQVYDRRRPTLPGLLYGHPAPSPDRAEHFLLPALPAYLTGEIY